MITLLVYLNTDTFTKHLKVYDPFTVGGRVLRGPLSLDTTNQVDESLRPIEGRGSVGDPTRPGEEGLRRGFQVP